MSEGQEYYPPPEPTPTRREQFVLKVKEGIKNRREKFEPTSEEKARVEDGEDEVGQLLHKALTTEFHADPEKYGVTKSTYIRANVLKKSLEDPHYNADKRQPMKENMVRTLGQYVEKMYEESGIDKPEELGENPIETFVSAAAHKGMEFYYKESQKVAKADGKDPQRLRLAVLGEHISRHTTTLTSETVVEIKEQFQERHNRFYSKVLDRLGNLSGVKDEERQAFVRKFYAPADVQTNNIVTTNEDIIRETTEWAEAAVADIRSDEANSELERTLRMGLRSVDRTLEEQRRLESEAGYAVRRLRKLEAQVQESDDDLNNEYGGRVQLYQLVLQSDKMAKLAWEIAYMNDPSALKDLQKEYTRVSDRYFAARVHAYPGIKQLERKYHGSPDVEKPEKFKRPERELTPEAVAPEDPEITPQREQNIEKEGYAVEHYSFRQIEDMREDERNAWREIEEISRKLEDNTKASGSDVVRAEANAQILGKYQRTLTSLNNEFNRHLSNDHPDEKDPEYRRSEALKRLQKEIKLTGSVADKAILLTQFNELLGQRHEYLESLVHRKLTRGEVLSDGKTVESRAKGIEKAIKDLGKNPEREVGVDIAMSVLTEGQKTLFDESAKLSKRVGGGLNHTPYGQLESTLATLEKDISTAEFQEKRTLLIRYAQLLRKKTGMVESFRKKLEKGERIGFENHRMQDEERIKAAANDPRQRQPEAVQGNIQRQPELSQTRSEGKVSPQQNMNENDGNMRKRNTAEVGGRPLVNIKTMGNPNSLLVKPRKGNAEQSFYNRKFAADNLSTEQQSGSNRRQPVRTARQIRILGQKRNANSSESVNSPRRSERDDGEIDYSIQVDKALSNLQSSNSRWQENSGLPTDESAEFVRTDLARLVQSVKEMNVSTNGILDPDTITYERSNVDSPQTRYVSLNKQINRQLALAHNPKTPLDKRIVAARNAARSERERANLVNGPLKNLTNSS